MEVSIELFCKAMSAFGCTDPRTLDGLLVFEHSDDTEVWIQLNPPDDVIELGFAIEDIAVYDEELANSVSLFIVNEMSAEDSQ